jgi:Flp pilus assembly pilin Flp
VTATSPRTTHKEPIMTATRISRPCSPSALVRDERGATLMEYIMLAGLVAIAAFAGFKLFGQDVQNAISGQANTVQSIPTAGN